MTAADIALSLISHTNAGKTTLARTLLARDVGEVRDAPHVTLEATSFLLVESPAGDTLTLWDTPGLGDSVRLAKRLRQQGNPIGWFLAQVWDRYRDRSFWLTQRAVRNVHEQADVVLYLVNAAEEPGDAGYLAPELEVLDWIGKPIIVLLNQTGPPREPVEEATEEGRWRAAVSGARDVREVLTLDAFARCWVQESALFEAVCRVLSEAKTAACHRLTDAWRARRLAQFDDAMAALAGPIARAASDRVVLPGDPFAARLVKSLGLTKVVGRGPAAKASREMGARLDADVRSSVERLIAIHDLEGTAAGVVQRRVASDVRTEAPVDEGRAAMMGGVVSGALTGLAADLAAGGLTFGAGMIAGAALGALGGAGLARGINVVRGTTEASVRWDDAFLDGLVTTALLRYLAVAHYGRGRGAWRESEYPAFWRKRVVRSVVARQTELADIWESSGAGDDPSRVEEELRGVLAGMARELLEGLYPGT